MATAPAQGGAAALRVSEDDMAWVQQQLQGTTTLPEPHVPKKVMLHALRTQCVLVQDLVQECRALRQEMAAMAAERQQADEKVKALQLQVAEMRRRLVDAEAVVADCNGLMKRHQRDITQLLANSDKVTARVQELDEVRRACRRDDWGEVGGWLSMPARCSWASMPTASPSRLCRILCSRA